jgi:hypothetical protein
VRGISIAVRSTPPGGRSAGVGGARPRTQFVSFGRRPYSAERLAAHLRREHERGRDVVEILADSYVAACGGPSLVRALLRRGDLIGALERDVAAAIEASRPYPRPS